MRASEPRDKLWQTACEPTNAYAYLIRINRSTTIKYARVLAFVCVRACLRACVAMCAAYLKEHIDYARARGKYARGYALIAGSCPRL